MRSHIVSRSAALLLCCGMLACLFQPLHAADRTESFADWLSSVVREADDLQVREELKRLRHSRLAFSQVISEASEIVSRNNEEFNLPLDASAASAQVYHVLLSEWNHFQTGNSMSSVPLPESIKSSGSQKMQQLPEGAPVETTRCVSSVLPGSEEWEMHAVPLLPAPTLEPMIHGIAIGAP